MPDIYRCICASHDILGFFMIFIRRLRLLLGLCSCRATPVHCPVSILHTLNFKFNLFHSVSCLTDITLWQSQDSRRNRNHLLKGQCHEMFDHFFGLKDSIWALYQQAKTVSPTCSFREDIRSQISKIVGPRSPRLWGHANFSLGKGFFIFLNYWNWLHWHHACRVVIDYADTMSA